MKKLKIILALIVVILCVGVATRLKDNPIADIASEKSQVIIYFVPITDYFSSTQNASKEDVQSRVFYLADDKDQLGDLVGSDDIALESIDLLVQKLDAEQGIGLVRWDRVTPNMKALSYEGKYLYRKADASEYLLKQEVEVSVEELNEVRFDPEKLTKINFLGDIMLSRHVNTQMTRLGFDYPWEKVAKTVADADITFANLEVPISDLHSSPSEGMSFVAPTKNLAHLKKAGIDIVSVANNHTANFGYNIFVDNLKNLREAGLSVCGGGLTEVEARTATVITKNNIDFKFLCQSAITGSLYADSTSAGVPYLGIEPWYRDDKNSLESLILDIKRAQEKEGVLIDSPHWGVEYKHGPNSSQEETARQALEAGADLVIGTHPHVVQSAEYYSDKYILYSLGNFIFDQEWSEDTKQGVMASAYFYGNKNMTVVLTPLEIENYAQPNFVTGKTAEKIINDIEKSSEGF